MAEYKKLFEPVQIGKLKLKNRIAMTGIGSALPGLDGAVTDDLIDYLAARAKGGTGLIITEVVRVCDGHGLTARYQLSAAHDYLIPGIRRLADAIHQYDCKLLLQLHHPGRETFDGILDGQAAISPSGIPCPINKARTREATYDEIRELIEQFGDAARRVQEGGADGVELHAGHGYLFHQFLSPRTNLRTDDYGGSFENRFRFLKDVVENIRKKCGRDFFISVRTPVEDFMGKEAIDIALGVQIAKRVEDMGMVDLINATVGLYESGISNMIETCQYPQGWRNDLLRQIKAAVTHTPILAVNGVRSPAFAEWMLEEGLADIVGLGRGHLADPDWANKAASGREKEIRECVSCLYCIESLRDNVEDDNVRNTCAINARTYRERLYGEWKNNGDGRKVVVVGAGAAGLEAARVLAERGFAVKLYEKEEKIGGQLNLAAVPRGKYRIDGLVNYYAHQLERLHVEVCLNAAPTAEQILADEPVGVFVSTGSSPIVPRSIPGVDGKNVYTVPQILKGEIVLRNTSVAVIGSGMTGLETAEYLASRGNVVNIVEMLDEIGKGVYFQNLDELMKSLNRYAVRYYPSRQLTSIGNGTITVKNLLTETEEIITANEVVLSLGVRSNQELVQMLDGNGIPVISVGDAGKTGRIHSAIHSGYSAAHHFLA